MLKKTRSMFVYAWDLWDEGIGAALDRLKRMGMTGITVTAAYHSGKFFLPHNPKKRIYYHSSGRVYYTPKLSRYGELQPQTGEAYDEFRLLHGEGGGDLFSAICAEAKQRDMEVLAWVVGFHHSGFGAKYPQYTVRSAFGDSYRHALCPTHTETRRYVWSIVEDLIEGYDLDGIVMESFDFMGMLHGDHHELVGIHRKGELEAFMGLCFCPACEEKARHSGIDTDALSGYVRSAVDRICNMGDTVDPSTVPQYDAYLQVRADTVEDVFRHVRRMADESGKKVKLFSTLWLAYDSNPFLYGLSPDRVSRYLDGWIACYPRSVEDVGSFVERAGSMVSRDKLSAGVRLVEPETTSAAQVKSYLDEYERHGVDGLYFYNYGLSSEEILQGLGEHLKKERN